MKSHREVTELDETVRRNATEMEAFLDVPYSIDVHVGGATLTVAELLRLDEGDVLRLDRLATENVLLTIEGRPMASAEVVLTKAGTGARVIEIT